MISTVVIILVTVTASTQATEVAAAHPVSYTSDYYCRPWYRYNDSSGQCVCTDRKVSHSMNQEIKCSVYEEGVAIAPGYCTTYKEGRGTVIAECLYFKPDGLNLTRDGYSLPQNISELNSYMCAHMNRNNTLCSDCIDGFGPSFTSPGFECCNCTGLWHGVLLYLIVDLAPITLLYLIMVLFHISMSSAPMTGYVMYSQFFMYELIYDRSHPVNYIVLSKAKHTSLGLKVVLGLYGIWNLDPIRYIVPPFCVSTKLNLTQVALLGYVSAFYPLCLIFLTWICVELHGRNFRPIVLLWRPVNKYLVKLRNECDLKSDLIGVFASFFFLSYSKLLYQSTMILSCQAAENIDPKQGTLVTLLDPGIKCDTSRYHLVIKILVSLVLLFCVVLPSVLFLLYSTRCFQACLSKCQRLNGACIASLSIFMERYQSCCRDGLNGGRDMRIFAGFYFILRLFMGFYRTLELYKVSISFWTYQTILFSTAALIIATVKPYKKTHVNILETLLLALAALLCHLLSQDYKAINTTQVFVLLLLPAGGFALYNTFVITRRPVLNIINQARRWKDGMCIHSRTYERQPLNNPTETTTNYATMN